MVVLVPKMQLRALAVACVLLLSAAAELHADAVITLKGSRIVGDITSETDTRLVLRTPTYGELHFLKVDLKSIERTRARMTPAPQPAPGASPAEPVAAANPFAPPPGSGAGNSILGLLSKAVGTPTAPVPPPAASAPGAAPAIENPFEQPPAARHVPVATASPTPAPAPQIPTLGTSAADAATPRVTSPPEIIAGYDAAVFDINPSTVPVSIFVPGQTNPVRESMQALLRAGTRVKTTTSRAQMSIRQKGDLLRIPEQSEVLLSRLSPDAEEVQVRVLSGSLWTDVSPRANPGDFSVETPDLTAGVKGTRFRIDVLPNQGSILEVLSGVVDVTSRNAPVSKSVRANEAVLVSVNGQLSEAIKIDPAKSREAWDQWAAESAAGLVGLSPVSRDLVKPLFDQIAADNQRWTETMEEANRTIAENKYLEQMESIAGAFMKFAEDTGYIPEEDEAWNLKDNRRELAGWNGPYIEGPIPPADPWNKVLVYRRKFGQTGNAYAIIYSFWSDRVDSKGNMPGDRFAMVPFYRAEKIRTNPAYNQGR